MYESMAVYVASVTHIVLSGQRSCENLVKMDTIRSQIQWLTATKQLETFLET